MGDTSQPTPISTHTYARLVRYTKRKHGQVRGSLRDELELAIENHVNGDLPEDELARIENDVARIKAILADERATADGGEVAIADPPAPPETDHTHTPDDDVSTTSDDDGDDVPHDKATKGTKAAYVFDQFDGSPGVDGVVIPPGAIDKKIDQIWGFGPRAADPLREKVFAKYHATAVTTSEGGWEDTSDVFVALGETPEAVDEAIDVWAEDPETVRVVPHEHFDGFEGGRPQTK